MPWSTRDTMSLRQEFISLAQAEGCNRRELCQRFNISPQTAYKWLTRYAEQVNQGWRTALVGQVTAPRVLPPTLSRPSSSCVHDILPGAAARSAAGYKTWGMPMCQHRARSRQSCTAIA